MAFPDTRLKSDKKECMSWFPKRPARVYARREKEKGFVSPLPLSICTFDVCSRGNSFFLYFIFLIAELHRLFFFPFLFIPRSMLSLALENPYMQAMRQATDIAASSL
jgi:hypothetical protein